MTKGPERPSVVAAAKPSASARKKAASKHSPDGLPVHSFRTLLADLATIVKQRVQPSAAGSPPFDLVTRPTPQQEKVLALLNLRLGRTRFLLPSSVQPDSLLCPGDTITCVDNSLEVPISPVPWVAAQFPCDAAAGRSG